MTSWADVRAMLKPFQVATAEAAIDGLWRDDTTSRFLVADEVGLGKTLVAKGVIAHLIEKLKAEGDDRIDIVYLCSNTAIARQNLLKLREFADGHEESADRLTKLVAAGGLRSKGVNIVALTPGTSFTVRASERAVLRTRLALRRTAPGVAQRARPARDRTREAILLLRNRRGVPRWRAGTPDSEKRPISTRGSHPRPFESFVIRSEDATAS